MKKMICIVLLGLVVIVAGFSQNIYASVGFSPGIHVFTDTTMDPELKETTYSSCLYLKGAYFSPMGLGVGLDFTFGVPYLIKNEQDGQEQQRFYLADYEGSFYIGNLAILLQYSPDLSSNLIFVAGFGPSISFFSYVVDEGYTEFHYFYTGLVGVADFGLLLGDALYLDFGLKISWNYSMKSEAYIGGTHYEDDYWEQVNRFEVYPMIGIGMTF
jgi:hypothetical protein